MTNIKMIVTDLDRTLLRPDKTISAYTADVLRRCQERGIKVVFATARSENSCKRFIEQVRPDAIISNGGAMVRIGEEMIYRAAIDMNTSNNLLSACLSKRNIGYITVDTDNGYFVNKPVDENDPGWFEYLPAFHVDFSNGLGCNAYKITVEITDEPTAYEIASLFPTVGVIPFSGEGWYRYADEKATKWCGIKALSEYSCVSIEEIAAFGDDFNDLEMLKNCGIGVAVANVIDKVKSVADFVCDTNDNDSVAKWIEVNVL